MKQIIYFKRKSTTYYLSGVGRLNTFILSNKKSDTMVIDDNYKYGIKLRDLLTSAFPEDNICLSTQFGG